MKTTIKLNPCSRISVLPTNYGIVQVEIESDSEPMTVFSLTPDQVGALTFGLEQAAVTAESQQKMAS